MPIFLVALAWIICMAIGVSALLFPSSRRGGVYVISISTGAALLSFLLSSAAFLVKYEWFGNWKGPAFIVLYLGGLGGGGLLGAFFGAWIAYKVLPNSSPSENA